MLSSFKVDVFTDVVCPWSFIGSVRLGQAIAQLPRYVNVEIEHHPFFLRPDTPSCGIVVADMIRETYGRDPAEVWAHAETEAQKSGIALDLSRQPAMHSTEKAHTLTRLARPLGTQHALANAISAAYFLEHRQVNDDDVLVNIATQHGFGRDEALRAISSEEELAITAQLARGAAARGVKGVPFFIFDGRYALSGAQPLDVFGLALDRALSEL